MSKKLVRANQIIRGLFPEKITMIPQLIENKKVYVAEGYMNLLSLAKFRIHGVGVPNGN